MSSTSITLPQEVLNLIIDELFRQDYPDVLIEFDDDFDYQVLSELMRLTLISSAFRDHVALTLRKIVRMLEERMAEGPEVGELHRNNQVIRVDNIDCWLCTAGTSPATLCNAQHIQLA